VSIVDDGEVFATMRKMPDGREILARELADTEALRAAEIVRAKLVAAGAPEAEIAKASDDEFRRVYDETFREALLGGS
jgi:hypothetical protein